MRTIVVMAAAVAVAALTTSEAGYAQPIDYPYCAVAGGDKGYESCGYDTMQQCLDATSGVGGHCIANPRYISPPPAERHVEPPVRRQR